MGLFGRRNTGGESQTGGSSEQQKPNEYAELGKLLEAQPAPVETTADIVAEVSSHLNGSDRALEIMRGKERNKLIQKGVAGSYMDSVLDRNFTPQRVETIKRDAEMFKSIIERSTHDLAETGMTNPDGRVGFEQQRISKMVYGGRGENPQFDYIREQIEVLESVIDGPVQFMNAEPFVSQEPTNRDRITMDYADTSVGRLIRYRGTRYEGAHDKIGADIVQIDFVPVTKAKQHFEQSGAAA